MSEYQYVKFKAVDRPLNDKELAFANLQSSRAEIDRWSFSCDYNFSSFRGNVNEMLRCGYDVFLQYANYGIREIKLRLPQGLPFAKKTWSQYIDGQSLIWRQDTKGPGGILEIHSYFEAGDLEEEYEFEKYLDAAVQLRRQIITGDLRGLYLLWLCVAKMTGYDAYHEDEDRSEHSSLVEPPVPLGLSQLTASASDLLWFFGNDPMLLQAAAQGIENFDDCTSLEDAILRWVRSISADRTRDILCQLLSSDFATTKAQLLVEIRDSQPQVQWPTIDRNLSFSQLVEQADALRTKAKAAEAQKAQAKARREANKAESERQARMKKMLDNPKKWLIEAELLVDARGTHNYKAAAEILFDLNEALGDGGNQIVRKHAAHLAKKHPTLNMLRSSLRKRKLLD